MLDGLAELNQVLECLRGHESSFLIRSPLECASGVVSQEGGATNTICGHTPLARARYSVVFYRDNLFVYRNGRPDKPVFSARGRP